MRFLILLCLFLLTAPVAKAENFTKEQKEEIQKMFETYLLENGETIIKSVEKYQDAKESALRQEAEVKAKEFLETLNKKENLPMAGNEEADITLVEFFDYNCGYCRRALEELVIVLEKDKNVKVIFFDMPILGPASLEIAKWSLAAHNQDKYFEFHQELLHHSGQKDEAFYKKIAKKLDLDFKKLKEDKDNAAIEKSLQENISQAQSLGIRGTPGFVINGKIFPGYMPASRILDIIETERKG